MQDCSNSIANTLELHLSCTNPSIYSPPLLRVLPFPSRSSSRDKRPEHCHVWLPVWSAHAGNLTLGWWYHSPTRTPATITNTHEGGHLLQYIFFHQGHECEIFIPYDLMGRLMFWHRHALVKELSDFFNSLIPGRCGSNFTSVFSNSFYELISWALLLKWVFRGSHRTHDKSALV